MHSAIYTGRLRHRRFFPSRHEFCYSSTLFYLDVDELPNLFSNRFFWSYNNRNFGSFRRSDYLGDPQLPLRDEVERRARELSGYCPNGPIRMLTNLRIFGFCFNPVTFYYLFNKGSTVPEMIVAEVNNTPWNERHAYVVQCNPAGKTECIFAKEFHVSPFNPVDMQYRWVSTAPQETLLVHMENHGAQATERGAQNATTTLHMDATLTLERQPWSATAINKLLLMQPWAAIKIPVAIYWQALRLFIKGTPIYDHAEFITSGEKP